MYGYTTRHPPTKAWVVGQGILPLTPTTSHLEVNVHPNREPSLMTNVEDGCVRSTLIQCPLMVDDHVHLVVLLLCKSIHHQTYCTCPASMNAIPTYLPHALCQYQSSNNCQLPLQTLPLQLLSVVLRSTSCT